MTYYLRMSFFYCNFAAYSLIAQRRIYIFCSPRRGGVQKCGGIQDIINSVLTRFVLTHLNLVNSSIQNNATLRCLWYVYTRTRIGVYLLIYIRTAWASVLLFVTKAIPEPQNAEQQDCSPAFLLCICPFEIP